MLLKWKRMGMIYVGITPRLELRVCPSKSQKFITFASKVKLQKQTLIWKLLQEMFHVQLYMFRVVFSAQYYLMHNLSLLCGISRCFPVFCDTGFNFAVQALANVSSFWRTGLFIWAVTYSGTVFTVTNCVFVEFFQVSLCYFIGQTVGTFNS